MVLWGMTKICPFFGRPWRLLCGLGRNQQGSVMVLTALAATVLVAFCGLACDVAILYAQRQAMQNSADAAALAAAHAYATGNSAGYVTEGRGNAALAGFTNGLSGATVSINLPPSQGAYKNTQGYVEARISQPASPVFMGLIMPPAWQATVTATAVATTSGGAGQSGSYCVLGLDSSAAATVSLANNADLPNAGCGVASNSTSATGLTLSNNAIIAGSAAIGGSAYALSNNAQIQGSVATAITTPDPYANVMPPSPPACTGQTSSGKNNVTVNLTPGHFCSGLNFSNNATVSMAAGTYYIDQQFSFSNNAVLNAACGVTIVINGTYAINIGNNAIINVTAPNSGTLSGIAFMGPRNGTAATNQVFSNNTTLNIKGAIYFPSQTVSMENNASSGANGCVQVIGDRLYFSNNANLPTNCSGVGISAITPPITIKLVQ